MYYSNVILILAKIAKRLKEVSPVYFNEYCRLPTVRLSNEFIYKNDLIYYTDVVDKILFNSESKTFIIEKLNEECQELREAVEDFKNDGRDHGCESINSVFEEIGDIVNICAKHPDLEEVEQAINIVIDTCVMLSNHKHGMDIISNILKFIYFKSVEMYVGALCYDELIHGGTKTKAQCSIVNGVHIGTIMSKIYNKRTSADFTVENKWKLVKEARTMFNTLSNTNHVDIKKFWV